MRRIHLVRAAVLWLVVLALGGCGKKGGGTPLTPSGTAFASNVLNNGDSYAHVFASPGTFGYHCGRHPSVMFGAKVIVSDAASTLNASVQIVSLSTPGFSPATVSIKPTGTVTWTNVHTMSHSVVSD